MCTESRFSRQDLKEHLVKKVRICSVPRFSHQDWPRLGRESPQYAGSRATQQCGDRTPGAEQNIVFFLSTTTSKQCI